MQLKKNKSDGEESSSSPLIIPVVNGGYRAGVFHGVFISWRCTSDSKVNEPEATQESHVLAQSVSP